MLLPLSYAKWFYSFIFILLFLVAVLARLVISTYASMQPENGDMLRYKAWGYVSYTYGLADAYSGKHINIQNKVINQPPGTLFILSLTYLCFLRLSSLPFMVHANPAHLLHFFVTFPSIAADMGIGILIYSMVEKSKKVNAWLAAMLFLYNPVVLYNSSFWGQTDALNNFFFMLSLFFFFRKSYLLSIFSFFLSLFIKFSLIIFLPLYIILFLYQPIDKKKILLHTLTSFVVILFFTLAVDKNPLSWLYHFFTSSVQGEDQHMTVSAFNFWWMVTKPEIYFVSHIKTYGGTVGGILSNQKTFGLTAAFWGYLFFSLTSIIAYCTSFLTKRMNSKNAILLLFIITALVGFLFLPRMHERYLYPIFPLLAVYFGRTKRLLWILIVFTLLNFINIYLVWHPSIDMYNFYFQLISTSTVQWFCSLGMVSVSLVFYIFYLYKKGIKE